MKSRITDTLLKSLKPLKDGPKLKRSALRNGLNLVVAKTVGKRWEYRFRFEGKWQTLSLGLYELAGLIRSL